VAPPPAAVPTPAPVPVPAPVVKPTGPKLQSSGWGLDLDVDVEEPKAPARTAPAAAARPAEPPPAAVKSPLPKDGAADNRKSARMTAQQLEARRAMAATLSTSMSAALKSEAVKREEQSEKAKAKTEGRVGQIGPAILTGEGVKDARSSRLILLGSIVVVLVLAGLGWLVFTDSPERAGLSAYTAEVDPARIRAGERVLAIQQRAWLVGLPPANVGTPPLIDLHDARIGSSRTIKLAAAKDVIATIKGLVPVEPGPVWVPPERVGALEELRRPDQKPAAFVAAVLKREKKAVGHTAFLEALVQTGMTEEDAQVVDLFLRGRTDAEGNNSIAKRWLEGDVPATMQVTRFYGSRGSMLLSRGQTFKTADVEYDGKLVRFTGEGWPQEWKVLTIDAKMRQKF
jgi:hypothetical protein